MAKITQRQNIVKVSGINGTFQTKSGGNISSDPTKVYDGGETVPDVLASPPEADNITVSRAYDVVRDGPVLRELRRKVGRMRATVSVTTTDADMVVNDKPMVYPDALLVGLSEPEADSSSGDASTYELEFAVGAYH
jgi:hypothetical protein